MGKEKIFSVTSRGDDNIQDLVGKVINVDDIETYIDEGDCCGYADIDVLKDTFVGDVMITKVEVTDEMNDSYDTDSLNVTFYGANKQIYQANLRDGSGSGWDYGAIATLEVKIEDKT